MTGNKPDGIAAIVLAAGASTRMGRPKQLMTHLDKPFVTRASEAVVDAGARPVIVVLGAHAEQIRPVLDEVRGISIVVNTEWRTGIASSISMGLRAIAGESWDGVLVTLGDQPLLSAESVRALMRAFHGGARLVASTYGGAPGVPAIFGAEHVPELLQLTGDTGARSWLRGRADEVTVVQLGGALFDVDTVADAERLAAGTGFG